MGVWDERYTDYRRVEKPVDDKALDKAVVGFYLHHKYKLKRLVSSYSYYGVRYW